MLRLLMRGVLSCLACATLLGGADAQCQTWMPGFGLQGTSGVVRAILSFQGDIIAAGDITAAGGLPASWIARWDGTQWTGLGAPLNGTVYALASFDDGSGPALFAGGTFTTAGVALTQGIAKWNGSSWSAVAGGTDGSVRALAVFDEGSGPALFAGGSFTQAGGTPAANLARYDGSGWSALGSGTDAPVLALSALVTASARVLEVGGSFLHAGGIAANRIATWDGANWSALASGVDADVRALAWYDDGAGRKLFAGGLFLNAGGQAAAHIARWDGASWTPLACGTDGEVRTLLVFDDGGGPQLYAGGNFNVACGVNAFRIARWDGTAWSVLAGGHPSSHVNALAAHFDVQQGRSVLLAGGQFSFAGSPSLYTGTIASWNGSAWSAIGGLGLNGSVHAVQTWTTASQTAPELYVGGTWSTSAGSYEVLRSWNGQAWTGGWGAASIAGPPRIDAICEHDDGSGRALYVGGFLQNGPGSGLTFENIARFDGQSFHAIGTSGSGIAGLDNEVFVLASFDSGAGPQLYAGGKFERISSNQHGINRIARWDGTNWNDVGGGVVGFYGFSDGWVGSLQVFDDGSGPALYVGGNFAVTGGGAYAGVARWNGSSWSQLGSGLDGSGPGTSVVDAMTVFDDGSGPALYCGGLFNIIGGASYVSLAKWDGTNWTSIAGAPQGPIYALRVFDDNSGSGPALEVGGYYGLARWDGANWSYPAGATDGAVRAFGSFDQGANGSLDLVVGGDFRKAGGVPSSGLAIRLACGAPGSRFCAGDGSLATPCPCANSGLAGRGCDNSIQSGGSRLDSSGTLQPDTLILSASHERAQALSIFLQGDLALPAGTNFGDGVRCVGGHLKRIAVSNAFGGAVEYPRPGDPSISQRSALLGDPLAPGALRFYQVYYRDPDPSFCPAPQGATWNVSNALAIQW